MGSDQPSLGGGKWEKGGSPCVQASHIPQQKQLNKFAAEIVFGEGKRRRRLAVLLEAFKHQQKKDTKSTIKS